MRFSGYVRVSRVAGREGPSFISPDVQRRQIEGWAQGRGAEIIAWDEDLDVSGGTMRRPGLDAAMARIAAGESEGIVVAKLDRFARTLSGALDAIARLEESNAALVSVAEGFDPTTPVGKMMLRLMLVLKEFERDGLTESWAISRANAVERGVHVSSVVPTGYRKTEGGQLEPEPLAAEAVAQAFDAKVGGASWREIAAVLEGAAVTTPYGGENWSPKSLANLLRNRVYLGEARSGEFVKVGAHPALVEPATFERAQRSKQRPSPRGGGSLLGGILRCAGCSYAMKADHMRLRDGSKARIYRCRGRHALGTCTARPAVLGSVIEPWVEAEFFDRIPHLQLAGVAATVELEGAHLELAAAEAEVVAYRDNESALGAYYADGLRNRVARVEAAERRVAELQAVAGAGQIPDVVELRRIWPELSIAERNHVLHGEMDCVFLRRGPKRNTPIADRATVLWVGEAPDGLPGPGLRGIPPREFVWG